MNPNSQYMANIPHVSIIMAALRPQLSRDDDDDDDGDNHDDDDND